jgi:hypothetical protein
MGDVTQSEAASAKVRGAPELTADFRPLSASCRLVYVKRAHVWTRIRTARGEAKSGKSCGETPAQRTSFALLYG